MNAKLSPIAAAALAALLVVASASTALAAEKTGKATQAPVAAPAPAATPVMTSAAAEQRAYAVVRSRLTALKACYLNGSRSGEAVSGKAVVSFTISAAGKATDIKVEAPALEGTGVAACVSAAVARWGFQREASAHVSFPVLFVQS